MHFSAVSTTVTICSDSCPTLPLTIFKPLAATKKVANQVRLPYFLISLSTDDNLPPLLPTHTPTQAAVGTEHIPHMLSAAIL